MVFLDKRLFPPSSGQFSLSNGHVGIPLDISESIDVEGILRTELQAVQNSEGILGLLRVGISEKEESTMSIDRYASLPFVGARCIVPWHLHSVFIDRSSGLVEVGSETSDELVLLASVDNGDIV